MEVIDVATDGSMRLRTGQADRQVSFDQARAVYVALETSDGEPSRSAQVIPAEPSATI